MHKILQEAVDKVKGYILNQVRFIYPTQCRTYKYDSELMEVGAEELTDEQVGEMLAGKSIISDRALLRLIGKIGLEDLYNEDGWLDEVADYIVQHRADCRQVWEHIEQLGKSC
jgi:hypothetical protein